MYTIRYSKRLLKNMGNYENITVEVGLEFESDDKEKGLEEAKQFVEKALTQEVIELKAYIKEKKQ